MSDASVILITDYNPRQFEPWDLINAYDVFKKWFCWLQKFNPFATGINYSTVFNDKLVARGLKNNIMVKK